MGTLTQLPFSKRHRRSRGHRATEAALWGLESSLSPCPGPTREPQLPFLAIKIKIKGVSVEIQHTQEAPSRPSLWGLWTRPTEKSKQGSPILIEDHSVFCHFLSDCPPPPFPLGSSLCIPVSPPCSPDSASGCSLCCVTVSLHHTGKSCGLETHHPLF